MQRYTVLVIDPDADSRESVRHALAVSDIDTIDSANTDEALELACRHNVSLITMSIRLPGDDGLQFCRRLRADATCGAIPLIFLAAADAVERTIGLEVGADDYLTRPFHPRELLARVRSVLRRTSGSFANPKQLVQVDSLVLDPSRLEVCCDGDRVSLTLMEFQVLHFLAMQDGALVPRSEIVEHILPPDSPAILERTVDVYIASIRRKLGANRRQYIQTVRGVGYGFARTPRRPGASAEAA